MYLAAFPAALFFSAALFSSSLIFFSNLIFQGLMNFFSYGGHFFKYRTEIRLKTIKNSVFMIMCSIFTDLVVEFRPKPEKMAKIHDFFNLRHITTSLNLRHIQAALFFSAALFEKMAATGE